VTLSKREMDRNRMRAGKLESIIVPRDEERGCEIRDRERGGKSTKVILIRVHGRSQWNGGHDEGGPPTKLPKRVGGTNGGLR